MSDFSGIELNLMHPIHPKWSIECFVLVPILAQGLESQGKLLIRGEKVTPEPLKDDPDVFHVANVSILAEIDGEETTFPIFINDSLSDPLKSSIDVIGITEGTTIDTKLGEISFVSISKAVLFWAKLNNSSALIPGFNDQDF